MEVRRIKSDELYHHGIKGQEWGEQNGPPYPLDSKTSAAVKRSAKDKKLDRKKKFHGKVIDKRLKRLERNLNKENRSVQRHKEHLDKKIDKRSKQLTADQVSDDKKLSKLLVKKQQWSNLEKDINTDYKQYMDRINTTKKAIENYTLDDFKNEKKYIVKQGMFQGNKAILLFGNTSMAALETLHVTNYERDQFRLAKADKNRINNLDAHHQKALKKYIDTD